MSLAQAVAKVEGAIYPTLEAVIRPAPADFAELLSHITNVRCSPEEFQRKMLPLSARQAQTLLTATLHRTLAYSAELLPLEEARALAAQLVAAAGPTARFFSNCEVADEVSGVGGWHFMVTNHMFESVLYCVTPHETALLVAADED